MHAIVHPADEQDRDGGLLLLAILFGMYPFLRELFAGSGDQGPVFAKGVAKLFKQLEVEIVRRSDKATGFVVVPKRWASSASSPGSTAAWPKTGKTKPAMPWFSCNGPRSASWFESYVMIEDVSERTLSENDTAQKETA